MVHGSSGLQWLVAMDYDEVLIFGPQNTQMLIFKTSMSTEVYISNI